MSAWGIHCKAKDSLSHPFNHVTVDECNAPWVPVIKNPTVLLAIFNKHIIIAIAGLSNL